MGATLASASLLLLASGPVEPRLLLLAASLVGLTVLGLIDDISPLGWRLKLVVQIGCAFIATAALPASLDLGLASSLALSILGTGFLVGMINLVNFIDGIDEITAAHALPSLAVPVLLAAVDMMPLDASMIAGTAIGALIGFWFWNRHPAQVFLGDCGSLPVGLLLGWLSLVLAIQVHPISGITVLLYPLADGGSTLLRRLLKGESLTQPHRQHAYQKAVDAGLPSRQAAGRVGLLSLLTASLALVGVWSGQSAVIAGTLIAGLVLVAAQILAWCSLQPLKG